MWGLCAAVHALRSAGLPASSLPASSLPARVLALAA